MLVALAGLMMAGAAGVAGVVEQRICGVKPGERGHGANLLQHLHRELQPRQIQLSKILQRQSDGSYSLQFLEES